MNINRLINELKKKIGLVGHLSNIIDDNGLRDIIYMTLDEFNRVSSFPVSIPLRPYVSSMFKYLVPVIDQTFNNSTYEVEIAPEIIKLCQESGVQIKDARLFRDSVVPVIPQSLNMKQDMVTLQNANWKGMNTSKPRLRVRPPNTIVIENFSANLNFYQAYRLVLRMTHPRTLSTISIGLERWFEELCRKNIEIVLYNNNLRFLNIDLGSIRVELNIENFQNAASEKEDLLEKIRSRAASDDMTFHMA